MARGRVLAALASVVLAAAGAGCGGGDDPDVSSPGADEAEQTVRDFLSASLEGDGESACALLDDQALAGVEQSFSCEDLIDAVSQRAEQGKTEFDGVPIDASNVDELELQSTVSEDERAASVTGPTGKQTVSLTLLNGEWVITAGAPAAPSG
jgi:hypothetical protein